MYRQPSKDPAKELRDSIKSLMADADQRFKEAEEGLSERYPSTPLVETPRPDEEYS